jgi:O-antigen ligase
MSIRVTVLYLLIAGLSVYAWKDWFKSLCGLIVLMALIEHEDMPRLLFGIPGLNMWNFLFGVILLAWAASRRREGLSFDMPRHIVLLLGLYLGVIVIGVVRAILDRGHLEGYPVGALVAEELINTVKWLVPAILLFDGCRTRSRVVIALICLLAMHLLITGQVIKRIPPEAALGGGGEDIQGVRLRQCDRIGYSSCDMSTLLAGASWGMLASLPLVRNRKYKFFIWAAAGLVAFGQALTGGRAGYAAWGATGLVLCTLKWRKYLLLAPVLVVVLPVVLPGTVERMFHGFGSTDAAGQETVDDYEVTSGRNLIWPEVIDKIGQSPIVGYGRRAMNRTGLTEKLMRDLGEGFPHPHNMYLETLLDNGVLGSTPIFLFWAVTLYYSVSLFRSRNNLYAAVGGLALALMLAQLFAGIGSQHFYPRESTFCVWMAMLLALRVHAEERRAQQALQAQPIWSVPAAIAQGEAAFAQAEEAVWQ